jgi:hypothetical protein
VEQHRHAIGRELHVEFDVAHAERDRGLERLEGVLGELGRVSAMGNDFWQGLGAHDARP